MLNMDLRVTSQNQIEKLANYQRLLSLFTGFWLVAYVLIGLGSIVFFQIAIFLGLEALAAFTLYKFGLRAYLYQSKSFTRYRLLIIAANNLLLMTVYNILIYLVLSSGLEKLFFVPLYINLGINLVVLFIIAVPWLQSFQSKYTKNLALNLVTSTRLSIVQILLILFAVLTPSVVYALLVNLQV